MGMAQEFKAFAMRGNVVDMAVGIIIGAAFGKIISAFVGKIVMPLLGLVVGGVNFSDLVLVLSEAGADGKPIVMGYGEFVQAIFDFVIVAFAIFMAVKGMNSMKKKEEEAPAAPAEPSKQEVLLAEIRDALKK